MRNDDYNCATSLCRNQSLGKCRIAFGVQICIWLVKQQQERSSEKGPCQSDPLPLAGREQCATVADAGVVAIW